MKSPNLSAAANETAQPGGPHREPFRVWSPTVRLPVLGLVAAAAIGALLTFGLVRGFTHTSSTLPARNTAAGFIDAVRAGDPGACSMSTPAGASDLVHLLQRAGAVKPSSGDACAEMVTSTPAATRSDAMRSFLGVLGYSTGSAAGGSVDSGSTSMEWGQTTGGRYAVVVVRRHGADGLLVDAIRLQSTCPSCQ